jgi:endonuclease/exonuclease/phosphatase family metal-dependent hydrolase
VKRLPPLPDGGLFGTLLCEANLAGQAVQIADVHLRPTVPPPRAGVQDILKLWGQSEAGRAKEIAYISKNTDANLPRIIAGDFNSMPGGAVPDPLKGKALADGNTVPAGTAPEFLKAKGFIDSLASADPNHEKVTTWKGSFQGLAVRFRLDYVFHTKDIASTACRVLPTDASDHAMVVSTLRWAATASLPAGGSRP